MIRTIDPPLGDGLLPGITRQFVIGIAKELGAAVEETGILPVDAQSADEVFVTGTTREITPVTKIDDSNVASGQPGPVTRQLMAAFKAKISG